MKNYTSRHPFVVCLLVVVAAFGLAPLSEAAFPASSSVRSVSDLSPEELEPPSE
ncbi:MAG: hypothetical protein H0U02_04020 [Rubrobacter sp.]|nr:hypothetical protein [Rubrobacter sp.]